MMNNLKSLSTYDVKVLLVRFLLGPCPKNSADRSEWLYRLDVNCQRNLSVYRNEPDFVWFVLEGTPDFGYAAYKPLHAQLLLMTSMGVEGEKKLLEGVSVAVDAAHNGSGVFAKHD